MTDDELIAAFESTELPTEQFTHSTHVRVGWWYLHRFPLPEALARFSTGLQRYAASKGANGKYHETITVAYMLIIAERVADHPNWSWDQFAAAHPDLLVSKPSVLGRYYSDALLASDRARRVFVMPDRMLDRDQQVPSGSVRHCASPLPCAATQVRRARQARIIRRSPSPTC